MRFTFCVLMPFGAIRALVLKFSISVSEPVLVAPPNLEIAASLEPRLKPVSLEFARWRGPVMTSLSTGPVAPGPR